MVETKATKVGSKKFSTLIIPIITVEDLACQGRKTSFTPHGVLFHSLFFKRTLTQSSIFYSQLSNDFDPILTAKCSTEPDNRGLVFKNSPLAYTSLQRHLDTLLY